MLVQMSQVYSQIQKSMKAGRYEPVSLFSCKPDETSTFASDLPTREQVAEAAWAAGKASAGHLAALKSQVSFDTHVQLCWQMLDCLLRPCVACVARTAWAIGSCR